MEDYLEENKKKRKKLAFTLVELLAVIVILAIILVIAVPKIMDTITKSRRASIESAAKLIARSVETNYQISIAKGEGETLSRSGSCMNLADIDTDEYKACTYTIDDKGKAKVNLEGTDDGKFSEYVCCNATTSESECTTLVTDISACPNAVVVDDDDDEEEETATPAACFTVVDTTGGVKITGYTLDDIESYDIDKTLCLNYVGSMFSGISSDDLDKVCSKEEITYNSNTGDLVELARLNGTACTSESEYITLLLKYNIIKNVVYDGDCTSDVIIPSKINGKSVVEIGDYAFTTRNPVAYEEEDNINYMNLNEESIQPSFTGSRCYFGLELKSVTLPKTLKTIGERAFFYHMLSSIVIPDSVESIGDYAFVSWESYYGLDSLTLGSGLKTIGEYSFSTNMLSSLTLPNSVESIAYRSFYYNSITSVNLGNGITTIGEEAFWDNNISTLVIGKNVTSIGNWAFSDNSNLHQSGITDNHENYLTVGTSAFDDETIVLSNSNLTEK